MTGSRGRKTSENNTVRTGGIDNADAKADMGTVRVCVCVCVCVLFSNERGSSL